MAPACRALTAAEQVADDFFVPSPNAESTENSRLEHLWNARRNAAHRFNRNADILAEHSGNLPADIVIVPDDLPEIIYSKQKVSARSVAGESTRPQTLAFGLTDSTVGQLAWMVDKFKAWTWPSDSAPEEILGLDKLLAHVSLYWFTATAGTSAYIGYATTSWGPEPTPSVVPTGSIQFAHDIGIRQFDERTHRIVRWTDVPDRGGHFAAMEEPEILVTDIRTLLRDLR